MPLSDQQKELAYQSALKYRKQPELYYREVLKVNRLWQGQIQMLRDITKYNRLCVASGHALGKDFIFGGAPLWFLQNYYPAKVIMTAPTDRQIDAIMMAELKNHYYRGGGDEVFYGDLQSRRLIFDRENHFALAFTTKETGGQVGKFQGFHTPNMLVIVSEAQAIEEKIFEELEGITTSANSKVVLLGNPLHDTGYFAKAIRGSEYHTIHLSCLDTPNYKQKKEIIKGVASYEWVENMRKRYGEHSPM